MGERSRGRRERLPICPSIDEGRGETDKLTWPGNGVVIFFERKNAPDIVPAKEEMKGNSLLQRRMSGGVEFLPPREIRRVLWRERRSAIMHRLGGKGNYFLPQGGFVKRLLPSGQKD